MTLAIGMAAGLIVYNSVTNLVRVSDRLYLFLNVSAGVSLLALTFDAGLTPAQQGLLVSRGWGVGLALAAVVVAGVAALARSAQGGGRARRWLTDLRAEGMGRSELTWHVLVRIPVGTAAFEEVAFRGALLAAFAAVWSTPVAVAASSAAFGLWHVVPTIRTLETNRIKQRVVPVALAVVGTAAAGALLAGLRLVTGSVVAPTLVHWAANASGLVAAARVVASAPDPGRDGAIGADR